MSLAGSCNCPLAAVIVGLSEAAARQKIADYCVFCLGNLPRCKVVICPLFEFGAKMCECQKKLTKSCVTDCEIENCPHAPFDTRVVADVSGLCIQTAQHWARANGVPFIGSLHVYLWTIKNVRDFQVRPKPGVKKNATSP